MEYDCISAVEYVIQSAANISRFPHLSCTLYNNSPVGYFVTEFEIYKLHFLHANVPLEVGIVAVDNTGNQDAHLLTLRLLTLSTIKTI